MSHDDLPFTASRISAMLARAFSDAVGVGVLIYPDIYERELIPECVRHDGDDDRTIETAAAPFLEARGVILHCPPDGLARIWGLAKAVAAARRAVDHGLAFEAEDVRRLNRALHALPRSRLFAFGNDWPRQHDCAPTPRH